MIGVALFKVTPGSRVIGVALFKVTLGPSVIGVALFKVTAGSRLIGVALFKVTPASRVIGMTNLRGMTSRMTSCGAIYVHMQETGKLSIANVSSPLEFICFVFVQYTLLK